jgi:hypothetical protein
LCCFRWCSELQWNWRWVAGRWWIEMLSPLPFWWKVCKSFFWEQGGEGLFSWYLVYYQDCYPRTLVPMSGDLVKLEVAR